MATTRRLSYLNTTIASDTCHYLAVQFLSDKG